MSCQFKATLFLLLIFPILFISGTSVSQAEDQFYAYSAENQDLLSQGPESIYKVAVELYKRQEYQKAKEKFQRVKQLKYNYKATDQFLERIEQHLNFEKNKVLEQKQKELEREAKKEEDENERVSQIERKLVEERLKEKERLQQEEKQAKLNQRMSKKKIARARKRIQAEKIKEEKSAKQQEAKYLREVERKRAQLNKERLKRERLAKEKEEEEKKLLAEIRKKEEMRYAKQQEFAQILNEKREELQKRKQSWETALMEARKDELPSMSERQPSLTKRNLDQFESDLHQKEALAQSLARVNELDVQLKKAFSSKQFDLAIDLIKRLEGSLAVNEVPSKYENKVRDHMAYYAQRIDVARQREQLLKAKQEKEPVPEIKKISLTPPSSKKVAMASEAEVPVAPIKANTEQLINKEKKELLKQRQHQRRKELLAEVDGLYKKGLHYYKNGDFDGAREIFMEVDRSWPEYKLTRRYLNIVNEEAMNKKVLQKTLDVTAKKVPKTRSHIVAEALDAIENNY